MFISTLAVPAITHIVMGRVRKLKDKVMLKKGMVTLGSVVILFAQILTLGSCPKNADQMLITDPDFAGFVSTVRKETRPSIFAESHADKLVHRCAIKVTDKTTFYRWDGEDYQPSSLEDVQPKDKIQVWFFTPAKVSFPEDGKARQVIVSKFRLEIKPT